MLSVSSQSLTIFKASSSFLCFRLSRIKKCNREMWKTTCGSVGSLSVTSRAWIAFPLTHHDCKLFKSCPRTCLKSVATKGSNPLAVEGINCVECFYQSNAHYSSVNCRVFKEIRLPMRGEAERHSFKDISRSLQPTGNSGDANITTLCWAICQ